MTEKAEQAEILLEAMPYIEKYQNKILVIKYGGNAMTDETLKKLVMRDMTLLQFVGIKVVLVHGGGPEISQTLQRMGIASRFVGGLRYTDEETAEVVRMVLAGKVNKGLVHLLGELGARAAGLSGIDGRMLLCSKESEELGFVGKIDAVDTDIIVKTLEAGYLPVISSVGFDDDGNIYNINLGSLMIKQPLDLPKASHVLLVLFFGACACSLAAAWSFTRVSRVLSVVFVMMISSFHSYCLANVRKIMKMALLTLIKYPATLSASLVIWHADGRGFVF